MEHGAAATLFILLIDGWQGRCVEMTPLERPERRGSINALGGSCVFLAGSFVYTGGCAGDVHTCIVATSVIPGRMTVRFPAVDEHTVPD